MDDSKKKIVMFVVIGLCLLGAVVSYFTLGGNAPKDTPQLRAAQDKSQAMQAAMVEEQAKQPKPPEAPAPPPKKGSVPIKR